MQPFEKGDCIASLRIVSREKRGHYQCSCYRCHRVVSVAACLLRRKKASCRHCYPERKASLPQVFYDRHGWVEVSAQ